MEDNSSISLIVKGKVQGVSFRWFTVSSGKELGLNGYAKNRADGTVEVQAVGRKADCDSLIEQVKQGPALSQVDDVEISWLDATENFTDFEIRY